MRDDAAQHVVYVHGLWMPGGESLLLAHRLLREFGFQVHAFLLLRRHVGNGGDHRASARLRALARAFPRCISSGHSLGGLVIYRFFERYADLPRGRVVFLGTPCLESRAAVQAAKSRFVSALMGQSVADELLRPRERRWTLRPRRSESSPATNRSAWASFSPASRRSATARWRSARRACRARRITSCCRSVTWECWCRRGWRGRRACFSGTGASPLPEAPQRSDFPMHTAVAGQRERNSPVACTAGGAWSRLLQP